MESMTPQNENEWMIAIKRHIVASKEIIGYKDMCDWAAESYDLEDETAREAANRQIKNINSHGKWDNDDDIFIIKNKKNKWLFLPATSVKSSSVATILRKEQESEKAKRASNVKEFTLERADGVCEACSRLGPFLSKGRPYLESHHIEHIANGGIDDPSNTAGLCPGCHREIHYSDDKEAIERTVKRLKEIRRSE